MVSGDQENIEKLMEYVNSHRLSWDAICTEARKASLEHTPARDQAAVRGQLAIQELMSDLEEAAAGNDDERLHALLEICATHKDAWEILWEAVEAARTTAQAHSSGDCEERL